MAAEEYDILRSTIREYAKKTLEPASLDIERKGIERDVRKSISEQGFLGARISSSLGGSDLDEAGYLILLDEIASVSPSVSAEILMLNSFFYPLAGEQEEGRDTISKVLSEGGGVTVVLNTVLEGYRHEGDLKVGSSGVSGIRRNVLNRNASAAILDAGNGSLILVDDPDSFKAKDYTLGFRGLGMSDLSLNDTAYTELISSKGMDPLGRVLESADLAVSAIALGIVSGSLQKGIEYSRVRKTFEQPLSSYQPVAFTIASLKAEEEILRRSLFAEGIEEKERLMVKIRSLDLAKRASKYALQVHGGYGYFEDFGVEKFYRDSAALSTLFGRPVNDMERLARYIYGEKAGFI